MNNFFEKLNFKKIVPIYLIIAIIIGVSLFMFLGFKYKEKIGFMYNFYKVNNNFEETNYNLDKLKEKLDGLSKNSKDIVDSVILDKQNKIIFSSNNFFNKNTINLNEIFYKKGFFMDKESKIIYKLVDDRDLILNTIFVDSYYKVGEDYEDNFFFENEFNDKKVYLINYSLNKKTGEKIYFIINILPVENGILYLKITASIIILLFMIYWVMVALIIYQNALKSKLNPYLWGGIVLITNIIGVSIYLIYKKMGVTCYKCKSYQSKNNIYCTNCGTKINVICDKCGSLMTKESNYCNNCGNKKIKN